MFSVGDELVSTSNPTLRRVIVEVRESGYSWRYPEGQIWDSDSVFMSENSTDPYLLDEWVKAAQVVD